MPQSPLLPIVTALLLPFALYAEPVPVLHKGGAVHGYLILRSSEGRQLAVADLVNVIRGGVITSHLTYRFQDGSIDDETTTYTQGAVFKVLADHHIQKGPFFPKPIDLAFDSRTGNVVYHEMKDGKDEVKTDHVDIPPDISNGIVPILIQDFPRGADEVKLTYLTSMPKPRIVKLAIKPDGEDRFRVGGGIRRGKRYNIHIEIGGITGAIAPIIGKQPSDIQIWVVDGPAPAFVRERGALYDGGPMCTAELASPAIVEEDAPKEKGH